MFPISQKNKRISNQSLQVTRTYLQRGQAISRSLWIKVSPKHPLLKAFVVTPAAILVLTVLIAILTMLGFTLLAIALMGAKRGAEKAQGENG